MSSVIVARNARIFKDGVAIAFGKGFNTDNSAEVDKDYSVDSRDPAVLAAGNNTHTCTIDTLYTSGAMLTALLAGTPFAMDVAPKGASPLTAPYETWNNCVITKVGKKFGVTGGVAQNVSIEAQSVTVHDT